MTCKVCKYVFDHKLKNAMCESCHNSPDVSKCFRCGIMILRKWGNDLFEERLCKRCWSWNKLALFEKVKEKIYSSVCLLPVCPVCEKEEINHHNEKLETLSLGYEVCDSCISVWKKINIKLSS